MPRPITASICSACWRDELRVLQLTRYDRLGGSSRLRFYNYQAELAARGIEITAAPFFDDAYLQRLYSGRRQSKLKILSYYKQRFAALSSINDYDLIWLEKEALPFLPAWIELPFLRGRPYVIDFDDAWFHRYDQHRNPLIRAALQTKFPQLVSHAAATIAGSPYLADWAEVHGARKVVRLPTTVNLDRYSVKPDETGQDFVIGWMGSPSTATYLRGIEEALRHMMDNPGALLKLVGAGSNPLPHGRGRETYGAAVSRTGEGVSQPQSLPQSTPSPALMRERVIVTPWTEASEVADLATFSVGIMPLEADAWSEGKCAYKLIQYMAVGLPVVASPIGMNREVVQQGINGFLADTTKEWIAALTTLRDDPALRQRMGLAGRKLVEEKYSLAGNADLLAQTLRDAAGTASKGS